MDTLERRSNQTSLVSRIRGQKMPLRGILERLDVSLTYGFLIIYAHKKAGRRRLLPLSFFAWCALGYPLPPFCVLMEHWPRIELDRSRRMVGQGWKVE